MYFSNLIYKLKLYAATKTLTPIKYDGMNVKITDENFPRVMEIFASLEKSSSEEDLRQRLEMRPKGAQERVFREKELLAQINSKDVDMLFSQLEGLELLSSRDKTFKSLLKKKVDEINKLINQQEPDYQSVNPEHPVLDNEYLKLLEQVIHQALVQLHQEYITEALATLTNTEKLGQDALKVYELHRKYELKNPQALQFNLAYETYAKNKSELDIYVKIENALFADGFRLCFELQKALQHLMTVIEVDEARMLLDMSNQIELLQLEMSRRAAIPVLETNIPAVESEEPVRPIVKQPALLLNISQSIFNLKNLGILSSAICVGFLASILVPHAPMSVIYGVVASTAIVAILCFLKTMSPNEPTQTVHLSPC